ncbi:hypothetical protein JCM24511_00551 [Saitozyma sp. JCM 24511]|nr:hypothetical protein JCM24511_00551 [Saitozyma sp. JCM 24511]
MYRTFPRSLHASIRTLQSGTTTSPIELRLRDGLKAAMKARDRPAANCLKAVLAEVTNAAKASANPNEPASSSAVITALRKGVEKRREAALAYAPTSPSPHPENHSALTNEITLLQSFLPSAPPPEALKELIQSVVDSLEEGVRGSKGAVGVVMKGVMEKLGESAAGADRKEVGRIVGELLKK